MLSDSLILMKIMILFINNTMLCSKIVLDMFNAMRKYVSLDKLEIGYF